MATGGLTLPQAIARAAEGLQAGREQEGEDLCEEILQRDPQQPEALSLLAAVKYRRGEIEAAVRLGRLAVATRPGVSHFYNNLAVYLRDAGALAEAKACCHQALRLEPANRIAQTNLAETLLLEGNYAEGFARFESRFLDFELPPLRKWNGADLRGRTILLLAEQGCGDALQFIRYVPLVRALGGHLVLACRQAELRSLLQANHPDCRFLGDGETLPAYDFWFPIMSLPYAFPGQIPAAPYLRADPAKMARYRARLGIGTERKVGLVWAGRKTHSQDRHRSLPFRLLAPLLELPGLSFVSLQVGEAGTEAHGSGVLDLTSELTDFAETAALLECLDLVITVDTAVAHLAGALGQKTWVLLASAPDWRWLLERSDTPWYPTMTLFRQRAAGQWEEVVQRVARALSA